MIRFGTSGNPPNFFKSELGKNRTNAPDWIHSIGLNAYERMLTYGAKMKKEDALFLGDRAKKLDIAISVHAPYYIVFTSDKQRVLENSMKEMKKTIELSVLMGAKKIVLHPGFGNNVKKFITSINEIEKERLDVKILPETMGKLSQLGSLAQVIEICENSECEPCIDWGHLYARSLGEISGKEKFREVLNEIEKRLGRDVLKRLHCHFYPVEFTTKGEKKHRAFNEESVFPVFKPLGELIKEYDMEPTLISESRDSQDLGALEMKKIMEEMG